MGKSNWNKFVDVDKDLDKKALGRVVAHKKLFERIIAENPDRILEVGCGSGAMSYFLARYLNCEVVAIDKEEKIIERLKDYNELDNLEYKQLDAFDLTSIEKDFDIVFHQGLLEHFSDKEIQQLVSAQFGVADKVIFSVPSYYYSEQDFGNERLLKKKKWEEILSKYDFCGKYYSQRLPLLINSIKSFKVKQAIKFILANLNSGRPQLLVVLNEL